MAEKYNMTATNEYIPKSTLTFYMRYHNAIFHGRRFWGVSLKRYATLIASKSHVLTVFFNSHLVKYYNTKCDVLQF